MGGTACAGYWLGLSEQLSLDVKLDTAGPVLSQFTRYRSLLGYYSSPSINLYQPKLNFFSSLFLLRIFFCVRECRPSPALSEPLSHYYLTSIQPHCLDLAQ
jgi:hypothetical protein